MLANTPTWSPTLNTYIPKPKNNDNPIAKMKQEPHEPTSIINHSIAQAQPSTTQSSAPSKAAPPLYHSPATSSKDPQICPPPPSQQLSHSWILRQNTVSVDSKAISISSLASANFEVDLVHHLVLIQLARRLTTVILQNHPINKLGRRI